MHAIRRGHAPEFPSAGIVIPRHRLRRSGWNTLWRFGIRRTTTGSRQSQVLASSPIARGRSRRHPAGVRDGAQRLDCQELWPRPRGTASSLPHPTHPRRLRGRRAVASGWHRSLRRRRLTRSRYRSEDGVEMHGITARGGKLAGDYPCAATPANRLRDARIWLTGLAVVRSAHADRTMPLPEWSMTIAASPVARAIPGVGSPHQMGNS